MRWGIVGHGGIVPTFLEAARGVGHEVVAVVGRAAPKVTVFADDHRIGASSCDLGDLVGEVDAVYVATPHSSHRDISVALLEAGVPVLCEKPMAVNAYQVRQMVELSQLSGAFLMEAMWTRHLPVMAACRKWIEEGRLGDIQMVEANFGFNAPYDPNGRLWVRESAGGSLLDVGIYALTLAELVFQSQPLSFDAEAELSSDGVDVRLSVTAEYPNGGLAKLNSAINTDLGVDGRIVGSKGNVDIPRFWRAEQMTLTTVEGEKVDEVHVPHRVNGFEYQITEVARCLEAEMMESPIVPGSWSLAMAVLMDEIRSRVGVVYPCDGEALS